MSYNCDIDICPKQFNNEELIKLSTVLNKYRPVSDGNIVDGVVLELPYSFSDDYSSAIVDFAKDINGTFSYEFIDQENEDNTSVVEFVDGIKITD